MAAVTEVREAKLDVRPTRLRPWLMVAALGCLAGAVLVGILVGPVRLPVGEIVKEMVNRLPIVSVHSGLSQLDAAILWQIRVPRVVLGGLVGATLAMAGASYQGVFRNPLADPYLLGVAAGAGLGATLAVAFLPGRAGWPVDPLPLAAFAGAIVAVAATYVLGRSGTRNRSTATLILAGVAVAAFFTAGQTYVQQQHADTLREVYSWILAGSSYRRILPLSIIFGAAFLILADVIARSALSPAEIPIGVISALVGAPFFMLVLRRTRRLS